MGMSEAEVWRTVGEHIRLDPLTIRKGGTALLVYHTGDCDTVTVRELTELGAVVELPDGTRLACEPEDIGVGVDDELVVDWPSFGVEAPSWYR